MLFPEVPLITLNKNIALDLGIDYPYITESDTVKIDNEEVEIFFLTLEQVEIGDIILQNIQAVIHDSDFPEVALLGMSFLEQVIMKKEGSNLSYPLIFR